MLPIPIKPSLLEFVIESIVCSPFSLSQCNRMTKASRGQPSRAAAPIGTLVSV
jgi:hypothetical protein